MHHFNANPRTGNMYFKSFNDANTNHFIIHIGKNGVLRDVERANDW